MCMYMCMLHVGAASFAHAPRAPHSVSAWPSPIHRRTATPPPRIRSVRTRPSRERVPINMGAEYGAGISLFSGASIRSATHRFFFIVMARFMRAIHVFATEKSKKDVDDPDKPGHDVFGWGRGTGRIYRAGPYGPQPSALSPQPSTTPARPAACIALQTRAVPDHREVAAFAAGFAFIALHARFGDAADAASAR